MVHQNVSLIVSSPITCVGPIVSTIVKHMLHGRGNFNLVG